MLTVMTGCSSIHVCSLGVNSCGMAVMGDSMLMDDSSEGR